MLLGKHRLSILSDHLAIIQVAQLLKRREFILKMKRGDRARVQTKMVESIVLPFPYSSKLKNLVISRRGCAGTAKKCTKKRDARVHLLLCSLNLLLFDVSVAVAVAVVFS